MATLDGPDRDRTTGTTVPPDVVLDLRDTEPLVDLRGAPSIRLTGSPAPVPLEGAGGLAPIEVTGLDGSEHRDATQRARYIAVLVIAVLNLFDIVTTYVAISLGAHEANPMVAWMISSPFVALAKVIVCGSLIAGAVLAKHWRRRVTLPGLCTAWAVVGVYSVVVLLNTVNVLSRI
ncbi:MAG: DUF5658 family protein [Acidimicrobiales bacterium]